MIFLSLSFILLTQVGCGNQNDEVQAESDPKAAKAMDESCPIYSSPACFSSRLVHTEDKNGCRVPICEADLEANHCPNDSPPQCLNGQLVIEEDNQGCDVSVCEVSDLLTEAG